jgi:cytosine/adenosine deaminase-related metal-dependent hydrolase
MIATARWVLPIDRPPLRDGWVRIEGGQIAEVGDGPPPGPAESLGARAILPGLVNTHTHLELSWMAGRIPPAASMDHWIRAMMKVRRGQPPGDEAEDEAALAAAEAMRAAGVVLVGDVSNSLRTPAILARAGLGGVVFHELLGFNVPDPAALVRAAWASVTKAGEAVADAPRRVSVTVAAHAPYSVAPALFREIARAHQAGPLSVHLGESNEEMQFLRSGDGPIRRMLETLGVWTQSWPIPDCDPVSYMSRVGYLQRGMLAVHGVHLDDAALERLASAGAVLVTCPRSNVWVGGGVPRIGHFYATGVPVAIGTDSLASVATLSVFDELAELRRLAPEIAAGRLLDSATRVGAEALGFGRDYGTLAPGKRAALVAVDVPEDEPDVEEYLVSGVPPGAIRPWP